MATKITENGLERESFEEIRARREADKKAIYGQDIDLSSNTIDGNDITNEALMITEIIDLAESIYNNLDVDHAIGVALDSLTSLTGIASRKGGQYTLQMIEITVNEDVVLNGLDYEGDESIFTVADNNGNQFILLNTTLIEVAKSPQSLVFRAQYYGALYAKENTINTITTRVNNVLSINNSQPSLVVGSLEETDAQLRARRRISVSSLATSDVDAMRAKILALDDVVECVVLDNPTDSINEYGMKPKHSWTIVEGGSNEEIGNIIYATKTTSTPTIGKEVYNKSTLSGQTEMILFDRPIPQLLTFSLDLAKSPNYIDIDLQKIKDYIVKNLFFGIGEEVATSQIVVIAVEAIQNTVGSAIVKPVNEAIYDNATKVSVLKTTTIQHRFYITNNSISIKII